MEKLNSLSLQVDKEVNLLEDITFLEGFSLVSLLVEKDGQRSRVDNPEHFTPQYPGQCTFILSISGNGKTTEVSTDMLTIKPLDNTAVMPSECNLKENWDEWKTQLDGSGNNWTWYQFYENVGHLQVRKVLEELDKMDGSERAEKLAQIQLIGVGEHPQEDCSQIAGVWEVGSGVGT